MSEFNKGWREINQPFICMNPVVRYVRVWFLRKVIAWIQFDLAIARSVSSLGYTVNMSLIREQSKDLADRMRELQDLEIR